MTHLTRNCLPLPFVVIVMVPFRVWYLREKKNCLLTTVNWFLRSQLNNLQLFCLFRSFFSCSFCERKDKWNCGVHFLVGPAKSAFHHIFSRNDCLERWTKRQKRCWKVCLPNISWLNWWQYGHNSICLTKNMRSNRNVELYQVLERINVAK